MTGSAAALGEASAAASAAKPATAASGERIAGAAKRCAIPPTAAAVSPRNAWRRVIEQNRHMASSHSAAFGQRDVTRQSPAGKAESRLEGQRRMDAELNAEHYRVHLTYRARRRGRA